ncbi:hypothetical protein LguiA_015410 [Lonicera macranthoides]
MAALFIILILILTLFSLLSLKTESLKCPPLTFPHSDLKFLCKQNQTTIQFPSYGELIVKSISYNPKKLDLVDPNNCVHRVFFNLNLTLTPFRYYYAVKDFTYLNCSSSSPALISDSYEPVPCFSGPGFSVYVVDPGLEVPVFCKALKTVGIPFGYSDYLDDDSFGLGLTWDLDCGHACFSKFGAPTCFNGAHKTVLWISILIFMVAMVMISAKTYCSKKMDMMNETKKNQIEEVDKLLGDFEAL